MHYITPFRDLGLEEDLTIDHILSMFKLIFFVLVDCKSQIVRIAYPGTGHIQLTMSEHLHRYIYFNVTVHFDLPGSGAKFQPS